MYEDEATELSQALIERMQKVGGREFGRLAFEQFFSPPDVDPAALTLMQKSASIADPELYKAAETVCPADPIHLYEILGGKYKIAGVVDRAKGLKRAGELLSGSRAKALGETKNHAEHAAAHHLPGAVKHDPAKVTPKILDAVHKDKTHRLPAGDREVVRHAHDAHQNNTHGRRAERLGKVLRAEEAKVRGARAGAGALGLGAVAAVRSATHKKDSDK